MGDDVRADLASLVETFRGRGGEIAVVSHRGNRRYATTYSHLAELAGQFAAELERRGVVAGDRVVVWGANSAEWIGVFFGCLLRGVIVVPLDAAGSREFAERVIADVGAKLVVGDARLVGGLRGTSKEADLSTSLCSAQNDNQKNEGATEGSSKKDAAVECLAFGAMEAVLPREPLFAVSEAVTETAAFQIVFTSGTTSEPKGIVHTHRNVLASLRPIEAEMQKYLKYERWVHPLRFLHTLPLSHVFGQFIGLWVPALLGAELHFVDQLEPARMTEMIRRERISVLIAVPRVLQLMRAHLLTVIPELALEMELAKGLSIGKRWWHFRKVHGLLGWKFWAVISGGATLPAELEWFWNQLGFALIQGYGMTETAALVTLNHPFKIGKGTIGKALPGREVRLSEEGEILVRGDMLAGATWQGGAMRPREEEWLATGDLAARNEAGELRFLGRKGDVIVTAAGMNVYPADLEEVLNKQAGVRGCAVVACDVANGPEPVAVVIFAGNDAELDAAVRSANRGLMEHQQMQRVLRWPEMQLPYTATGKLLRRKVGEWACGEILAAFVGEADSSAALRNDKPREDGLLAWIAEVMGEPVGAGGDGLRLSEDLHLDSLGRVQLQSLLEQRIGVSVEDAVMAGVGTVGELRRVVGGGGLGELGGMGREADPSAALRDDKQEGLRGNQRNGLRDENAGNETEVQRQRAADAGEDVYPRWPWSWPVWALRVVFLELVMRPLVWLIAAPKVVGDWEALQEEPLLVIANHVTAYDGALVLYALPGKLRRRVAAAMSGEMLRDFRRARNQGSVLLNLAGPFEYWLLTALFNVFPLPRRRGFRRSFTHAGEAMDRGYSVLVFPEGHRSRKGVMQAFRPGIGLLARESGVPVLPVGLLGLGESEARWIRSRKIEVRLGRPMVMEEGVSAAEYTAELECALRILMG